MKKFTPFLLCSFIGLMLAFTNIDASSHTRHINTYPNLPAPIGKERVLITSAGQAMEGTVIFSIAESLHLDADYRPRALDTDLYDYQSIIIVLGYSFNGLSYIDRSFQEELRLTEFLVKEAALNQMPIILVNLASQTRDDDQTWRLFELIAEDTDYYIGLNDGMNRYHERMSELGIPATLVNELDDIHTPFNSAFR